MSNFRAASVPGVANTRVIQSCSRGRSTPPKTTFASGTRVLIAS